MRRSRMRPAKMGNEAPRRLKMKLLVLLLLILAMEERGIYPTEGSQSSCYRRV